MIEADPKDDDDNADSNSDRLVLESQDLQFSSQKSVKKENEYQLIDLQECIDEIIESSE